MAYLSSKAGQGGVECMLPDKESTPRNTCIHTQNCGVQNMQAKQGTTYLAREPVFTYLITWLKIGHAPAVSYQVDGLTCVAGVHDLSVGSCINEACHLFTSCLVICGGASAQRVHPSMHIGIVLGVVGLERVEDVMGLL
eukprot:scaffold15710_cov17-Tisochrysis_lutea.AAC.1